MKNLSALVLMANSERNVWQKFYLTWNKINDVAEKVGLKHGKHNK
jgi:hypothetical protein